MVKLLNLEQGSEEWLQARVGLPTSSNFDKIVTSNGSPSAQREKYLYTLAGELVTKTREETYKNKYMLDGIEREAEAAELYSLIKGVEVEKTGLFINEGVGSSPDRLVGDDGLLEIKCPAVTTHITNLLSGKMPTSYFQQVQGQMLVTEREWVDFMSYYPGIRPMIVRIQRNEKFLNSLSLELIKFLADLRVVYDKIKE